MRPAKREKSASRSTSDLAFSTTSRRRSARSTPCGSSGAARLELVRVEREVEADRRERDARAQVVAVHALASPRDRDRGRRAGRSRARSIARSAR